MSGQDNEATIKSVCVVIRTHMLDAARENIQVLRRYDVFKDAAYVNTIDNKSSAAETLKVRLSCVYRHSKSFHS